MKKNNFSFLLFKKEQEPRGEQLHREFNVRNNILIIRAFQQCNKQTESKKTKKVRYVVKEILTIPRKKWPK